MNENPSRGSIRRFVPLTLASPMLCSTLGIDGGAVFQIVAAESLGLSATAIGIAFGLGVVSLPVQIWAARMPLSRARTNLQIFLVISAGQAWLLALLVAAEATGRLAAVALAVTVTAEVSLSVLFATSVQPLLSCSLSSIDRQRVNTRVRAVGASLLAVSLPVFAELGRSARVGVLTGVGLITMLVALDLRPLTVPAKPRPVDHDDRSARRPRTPAGLRLIYGALAIVNFGAWPLLLVYVHEVLWPAANLGVVAALQLAGALLAALAWRPTAANVATRAQLGSVAIVGCGVLVAALRAPLDHPVEHIAMLAVVAAIGAATAVVRMSLLELAHRSVDEASSVRAFTMLDVVASTSLQLGLLTGGLLVTASAHTTGWVVDPYRGAVVACAIAACVAIARLRPRLIGTGRGR